MPLARYFFYVGGVLLALLFISDAYLPRLPDAHSAHTVSYIIRIHSDRKWPERVLYGTSLPTIIPPQIANAQQSAAAPVTIASAKARVREAFAQLRLLDASQQQSSNPKKARAEAAAPAPNYKTTHTAATAPSSTAAAIRLVCLLVSRFTHLAPNVCAGCQPKYSLIKSTRASGIGKDNRRAWCGFLGGARDPVRTGRGRHSHWARRSA